LTPIDNHAGVENGWIAKAALLAISGRNLARKDGGAVAEMVKVS